MVFETKFTMSSQNHTYSYSSSSFSSQTSSNGQTTGGTYQQTMQSNPSGTRIQSTSQNLGEPAVQETRYFDSEGRQVLEDGRTIGPSRLDVGKIQSIEDAEDHE